MFVFVTHGGFVEQNVFLKNSPFVMMCLRNQNYIQKSIKVFTLVGKKYVHVDNNPGLRLLLHQ